MLCALVSLIVSEAKPEEDDLKVYVSDLKECESVKNTNFVILSHWKIKYDRMVSYRTDEVIPK